jgi:hypothetical protein
VRRNRSWSRTTCLHLATEADTKAFFAHDGVQVSGQSASGRPQGPSVRQGPGHPWDNVGPQLTPPLGLQLSPHVPLMKGRHSVPAPFARDALGLRASATCLAQPKHLDRLWKFPKNSKILLLPILHPGRRLLGQPTCKQVDLPNAWPGTGHHMAKCVEVGS